MLQTPDFMTLDATFSISSKSSFSLKRRPADREFPLRSPDVRHEYEHKRQSLMLDWVENDKDFSIVLVENGPEVRAWALGTVVTLSFISDLFAHISAPELPKLNRKENFSVLQCLENHASEVPY